MLGDDLLNGMGNPGGSERRRLSHSVAWPLHKQLKIYQLAHRPRFTWCENHAFRISARSQPPTSMAAPLVRFALYDPLRGPACLGE
jgi:hypothetical protein